VLEGTPTRFRCALVPALALILGGCRCKPDDRTASSCPVPAAAEPDRLEVARRGDASVVDGRCDDPAYATAGVDLTGAAGKPTGALRVVHGGRVHFVRGGGEPLGA
jgi:hypothetical protein